MCVRVRPLDPNREEEEAWRYDPHVISQAVFPAWEAKSMYRQLAGRAQVAYAFDNLFGPERSTREIYAEALRDLVGTDGGWSQEESGKILDCPSVA